MAAHAPARCKTRRQARQRGNASAGFSGTRRGDGLGEGSQAGFWSGDSVGACAVVTPPLNPVFRGYPPPCRRRFHVKNPLRPILSPWVAVILGALGLVIFLDIQRARKVDRISAIGDEATAESAPLPGASLGGWLPRLVVPDHDTTSLGWLSLTRRSLETGDARVRRIDYENAPFGREVFSPAPYRWWLATVARVDHTLTGVSLGRALERAAMLANPLLHGLLLVGVAGLVAWRFGAAAAAVGALLVATLFPFGAEFMPGMPRDAALTQVAAIGSVLLLLSAFRGPGVELSAHAARWFCASAVVGALGLWTSVHRMAPVLVGIGVGALGAAWIARREAAANASGERGSAIDPRLWRVWGIAGALATFSAYVAEFTPDYLGLWKVRSIHPLYALAWLGGGEVLAVATGWILRRPIGGKARSITMLVVGLLAVAALPVAMRWTKDWGALATDLDHLRLAHLPAGPSAENTFSWIVRDGLTGAAWGTFIPLLLVLPAVGWIWRRTGSLPLRLACAIVLGVIAVQLGFAGRWLSAWNGVGAALVVLGALLAGAVPSVWLKVRWATAAAAAVVGLLTIPGIGQLVPSDDGAANSLDPGDVYGLVERDLARWLATRADPQAVVLAPHNLSATMHYYGGLRGLSSLAWENTEGLGVVIRIASASTPEEARELLTRRQVSYLVMPSWDGYLDVYAGIGMGELDGTFLKNLHDWKLPAWLQPVAYQLPRIPGFEGETVTILKVVEDQDDAAALSRIAEYFIDVTQLDRAATTAVALRRFPADFGALVARAQVDFARGDAASAERTMALLKPRVLSGGDRSLPWDRRLALAVVLTQAKLKDLAKDRVVRCIADADEAKLRGLSNVALYRLLVLSRAYDVRFKDPSLHEFALSLLPVEMRERLR